MKLDVQEIKRIALRELQYNTHDPVEATLRGLKMWLTANNLELKKAPDAREGLHQEPDRVATDKVK